MDDESLWGCGCVALILGLLIAGGIVFGVVKNSVRSTVVDTVVKSERIQDGKQSYYLVFGENEVYQNEDSWLNGKFNSSDVYRDIEPGKKYRFEVIGWRWPLMSWYRNIVKFEEVKEVE